MLTASSVFVLICISIEATVGNTILCNENNVNFCYSKIGNSTFLRQAIPYATEPELKKFCQRFDLFSKCYEPIRSKCRSIPLLKMASLEGDYASHGFQCNEGNEDFLRLDNCFSKADLQSKATQCIESLNGNLREVANESDAIVLTNKLCQAGNIYIGCVKNYVKVLCENEKATDWINIFNRKSLYPLLNALECPGFESSTTNKPDEGNSSSMVILGVLLGLFCLVILIILIVLGYFCVKNKYYQSISCLESLANRFKNQPPPYLPSNPELPRASDKIEDFSKFSFTNPIQLDQTYFHEEIPENYGANTYTDEYDNIILQNKIHKASDIPSSAFKHKASDAGGKSNVTVFSKDSGASCTSTPSTYFEPPTFNPFSRSLSTSNSNLDQVKEQETNEEYY